jgi:hypothetical protein
VLEKGFLEVHAINLREVRIERTASEKEEMAKFFKHLRHSFML